MWVLVVVITTLTGGQSQTIISDWADRDQCRVAADHERLEQRYYESFPEDTAKIEFLCLQPDKPIEGYLLKP